MYTTAEDTISMVDMTSEYSCRLQGNMSTTNAQSGQNPVFS